MNNLLDLSKLDNQLFIAGVLYTLCEKGTITLDLEAIGKNLSSGNVRFLSYTMTHNYDKDGVKGSITFSNNNYEQN